MQSRLYALFCAILCKRRGHLWILVSRGSLGTNPLVGTEGQLKLGFWEIKSYMWIFDCVGIDVPNPCIVQGSTVLVLQSLFFVTLANS